MGMYLDLWDVSDGHPKAREELLELRLAQERYEKIRKMNLVDIGLIFSANLHGEGTFDELIDRVEI